MSFTRFLCKLLYGPTLNHGWKRPHQGLYAINVDGAVSNKKGCSSAEIVIRDWSGKFCVGMQGDRLEEGLLPPGDRITGC